MADVKVLRLFARIALAAALAAPTAAFAFPPYRSSDAVPPTPYEFGVRLGLKLQADDGRSNVNTPLLRSSLGLPRGFEAIGQVEYSPRADRLADAALGGRWATRLDERLSVGVEAMGLLPVQPAARGVGVEVLGLATLQGDGWRLHLNAGGYDDPRRGPATTGWRASALAEVPRGDSRFGVELFGRETGDGRADLRLGVGLIRRLGRLDVRTAVHAGLSDAAPDVVTSLWVATTFPPR